MTGLTSRRGTIAAVLVVLAVAGCSAPSPTLTPAPTPVATPKPTRAPTPPTPVADIPIPASIDATGASDVSTALNSFVESVPDGSTIVFKAGGVYRLGQGLRLRGRHDLTLEGNGSTLRSYGDGQEGSSLLQLLSARRITIRDFNLVGNSPTPGVFNPDGEFAAGVAIYGGGEHEISDVKVTNVWGDCLYVDQSGDSWADDVWFHDSTCQLVGRQGVAILAGSRVTVERVTFDRLAMHVLDIEPYVASGGGTNIVFRANTVMGYGRSPAYDAYFFAANGVAGSLVRDVTVTANTVSGGTLHTSVRVARRENIVFTNNTSLVMGTGPILLFSHVDGLTITGNDQPLSSGVLARITDSTGVTAQ